MISESQDFDRKSLCKVTGPTADFGELAQDCVCFANGTGGTLLIGIEDDADAPPYDQRVDPSLPDPIRKRIGELTVNVQVAPELKRDENGGEYLALTIPRAVGVASTSDGRYFLRVGDTCRPIFGDDVMRLANERPATPWEIMTSLRIARANADAVQVARVMSGLRASDRVKSSVKEKTDDELLSHYGQPALLREAGLDALTTLTRVQPHRLRALILEDLERYPGSAKRDIHRRVGPEIPERTFRRALQELVIGGRVEATGETRARTYTLKVISGHGADSGQ